MSLKENKYVPYATGIGLLGLAAVIVAFNSWPEKKFSQDLAYFSDDNGKTWYTDSIDLIPPYQHNGKEADGAVIYSYAGGSKQFCGYLFRFPEKIKQQIENAAAPGSGKTPHGIAYGTEIGGSREVESPGSTGHWAAMGTPAAGTITKITAPDGSDLDSVLP